MKVPPPSRRKMTGKATGLALLLARACLWSFGGLNAVLGAAPEVVSTFAPVPMISLKPSARHNFNLEASNDDAVLGFDGGVLEISSDRGSPIAGCRSGRGNSGGVIAQWLPWPSLKGGAVAQSVASCACPFLAASRPQRAIYIAAVPRNVVAIYFLR